MSRKGCFACQADAALVADRRHAALEKVNARRAAIGWRPFYHAGFYWHTRSVAHENAEVCARIFGGTKMWWDKEPGYVKVEVKAALRRSPAEKKAPRDKRGHYLPLDYSLPLPTLAASSKRLAKAELIGEDEIWTGPKAAEQYIAYRREQLGLNLEVAAA